ncbi:MAG: molybdopterin-dependent oxidoreductase [Dissulfurispiraceae bacterium]
MITVTIDGMQVVLQKPVTILEAARQLGIVIPTLCNHESLEPYGGCRLCLVEIEKTPRLQTACTQYVDDGMVIYTGSQAVIEARRSVLEFLLINHPLDCPVCDKAGQCELQDAVAKYGAPAGRFIEDKRNVPENFEDPLIVRNMQRCISCARCIRMCDGVQGASAICMVNRSGKTRVEPFSGGRFDCEYCGNCLTVCPVGALLSKDNRHAYRPWMIDNTVTSVCPFCGVGCCLNIQIRDNAIVRVVPQGSGVGKSLLCNRGRFGCDVVKSSNRLTSPLIRTGEGLRNVTWDEAIGFVVERLVGIKQRYGGTTIGGIASGRCSNEDNYAFQKFFRSALDSNNIDSAAGLSYGPVRRFLEGAIGRACAANDMERISRSRAVLVIGEDPTSVNPVLGLQIRAASRKGIPVITIGHMPGLRLYQAIKLTARPSAETILLRALVSALKTSTEPAGSNSVLDDALRSVRHVSLKEAESMCGISQRRLDEAIVALVGAKDVSIIIGTHLVRREDGHLNLLMIACLAYLLQGRIFIMSESPNDYGLFDMGCHPYALLGAMPSRTGLGVMEMIDAAVSGGLKALYVMGDDIFSVLPDKEHVKAALSALQLLVVQDSFLTETAGMADVVLPVPFWAEQEGSFTNLESKTRQFGKALQGPGKEGWRIISEISKGLGYYMNYNDAAQVRAEIESTASLQKVGADDERARILCAPSELDYQPHEDDGKIVALVDFPLLGQSPEYGCSPTLKLVTREPYVRLGTTLAGHLSIEDGDEVSVSSDMGTLRLHAVIDADLPGSTVMIPRSTGDKGILTLMKWRMNQVTKCPVFDKTEVVISKIPGNQEP